AAILPHGVKHSGGGPWRTTSWSRCLCWPCSPPSSKGKPQLPQRQRFPMEASSPKPAARQEESKPQEKREKSRIKPLLNAVCQKMVTVVVSITVAHNDECKEYHPMPQGVLDSC